MNPLRPDRNAGVRERDRQFLHRSNTLRRKLPPDRRVAVYTQYIPIPLDALAHIH